MSAPDLDLDADIPLRENLGGWLRLALTAAVVLLVPTWLFASTAVFEAMGLPPDLVGFVVAGAFGALSVLVLLPVPLLLLLGGAALDAAHGRWERRRQAVDDLVDREAVMSGVSIRSRVEGAPTSALPSPRRRRRAELAPIGRRVGAAAIDWILAWTVPGALGIVIYLAVRDDPDLAWLWMSGAALGALGVAALQTAGVVSAGQTVGKRLLRIRITTEEGEEVGFVDGVLLRYGVWALLVAIPLGGALLAIADLVALLTDPARQSLHDQLARTVVVAGEPEADRAEPPGPDGAEAT